MLERCEHVPNNKMTAPSHLTGLKYLHTLTAINMPPYLFLLSLLLEVVPNLGNKAPGGCYCRSSAVPIYEY